jgi:hypothetical protein
MMLPPKRLVGGSLVASLKQTGEGKEKKKKSDLGQVEIWRGPGQFAQQQGCGPEPAARALTSVTVQHV